MYVLFVYGVINTALNAQFLAPEWHSLIGECTGINVI